MSNYCKNCGAWKGLHNYETYQCPKNGVEAAFDKLQQYHGTVYVEDNSENEPVKLSMYFCSSCNLMGNIKQGQCKDE